MIIFLFNSLSQSTIPPQYKDIVEGAKQDCFGRGLSSFLVVPQIMEPKDYDFNGIKFTLSDLLIGPEGPGPYEPTTTSKSSILGYSRRGNFLAIAHKSKDMIFNQKTVFVDPSTQTFHRILGKIETDTFLELKYHVTLYSVEEQDPTEILGNLQMDTVELNDAGYKCDATNAAGAQCRAWYGINWEDGNSKPNPKESGIPDVNYYAGAIGETSASAQIKFKSLFKVEVDFHFDAQLKAGLGLELEKTVFSTSIHVGKTSIPIYSRYIKILGVTVGFALTSNIDFNFNKLSIELPQKLIYYRSIAAKLSKSGKFVTGEGISTEPFDFSIEQEVESTVPQSPAEFLSTAIFEVAPELVVDFEISFQVGKAAQSNIKLGGKTNLDWRFSADSAACAFPWLVGTTQTQLTGFAKGEPLRICGHDFIKPFENEWKLYDSGVSARHCLLSKPKSQLVAQLPERAGDNVNLKVYLDTIHQGLKDRVGDAVVWLSQCTPEGECKSINRIDLGAIGRDINAHSAGFDKFETAYDSNYDLWAQLDLDGNRYLFTFPSYFFEDAPAEFLKFQAIQGGNYVLTLRFRNEMPRLNKMPLPNQNQNRAQGEESSGIRYGMIGLIVIGAVVAIVLVALVIRRRRESEKAIESQISSIELLA